MRRLCLRKKPCVQEPRFCDRLVAEIATLSTPCVAQGDAALVAPVDRDGRQPRRDVHERSRLPVSGAFRETSGCRVRCQQRSSGRAALSWATSAASCAFSVVWPRSSAIFNVFRRVQLRKLTVLLDARHASSSPSERNGTPRDGAGSSGTVSASSGCLLHPAPARSRQQTLKARRVHVPQPSALSPSVQ